MRKLALALVLLVPGMAAAQPIQPGASYILPAIGVMLPADEYLRTVAQYRTFRPTDPFNDVVADIKLDPGVFVGFRYGYGLTRRLMVEAEIDWAAAVHAIRLLELKPDTPAGSQPQYETTTTDARILQYFLNLTYFLPVWERANPFFTFGVGNHTVNLRQKGEVKPDPIYDRAIMAGLGTVLPANDRLAVRIEVRDFMYNFRYDNQFVDPAQAYKIVDPILRPDFINSTSASGTKFQNDVVITLGFLIRPF